MDIFNGLLIGFQGAFTWSNLLACFMGVLWGTLIGVLPGIGPVGGLVLLLPLTYQMDITMAMVMMAGIYYGCQYGGSTTSILANIPGEATSVVTCLDGYRMAQQGRAGPALAIAAIGSFIAGTLGVIGLTLIAPPMISVALSFGPPEFLALIFLGLSMVSYLSGKSIIKGLIAAVSGMMLGTIGPHVTTGVYRYTFGNLELVSGISLIPIAIGLFGVGEVLISLESDIRRNILQPNLWDYKKLMPSKQDFKDSALPVVRGGILGFFMGILPGAAAIVATFMSYALEKRISKHPEKFGTGTIEGVAGPEAANNAAAAGAMIPLLTLGIPYNVITALMLNAMITQGLQPSPLLMAKQPGFFWTIVASMYVGNIMLLVLNLPLVGVWANILRTPFQYLFPFILLFCVSGVWAADYKLLDLQLMVLFGLIGYLMKKVDFPGAPLLLGLILGPIFENSLGQSLIISSGNWGIFVSRPISATVLAIATILLLLPAIRWVIGRKEVDFIPKGQEG